MTKTISPKKVKLLKAMLWLRR